MKIPALIALTGIFWVSVTSAADPIPIYISPDLLDGATTIDLSAPIDPPIEIGIRANGTIERKTVSTCTDMLSYEGNIVPVGSTPDISGQQFQLTSCEAMAIAKSATPAAKSTLPKDLVQLKAPDLYPVSVWPSISPDEEKKYAKPGLTLGAAVGTRQFAPYGKNGLKLTTTDRIIFLTPLVSGDLDHSGWESVAYRWQAGVTHGTWGTQRLMILTKRDGDKSLREIPISKLLPAHD
jgi:hypothetical protein